MTRQSEAALAWITRVTDSQETEYLTQWNKSWKAYSLIGGHVEDGESFRECCIREIEEELHCTSVDYQVEPHPCATLRFSGFSKAAREETDYHWQVFITHPSSGLLDRLPKDCVWVQAKHIQAGRASDGQPIADQVKTVSKAVDIQFSCCRTQPNILFSLQARNQFEQRFAQQMAEDVAVVDRETLELTKILRTVFPDAETTLIQSIAEGFRRRDGEFILLLEVTQNGATTPAVVKLGPADKLKKELDNWLSCKPKGLTHDIVLMNLEPIYDDQEKLIALAYADAEQLIGVDQTMNLETAMLEAVRLGVPTIESVADLIFQLYQRLGLLLYRHSFNDAPPASVEEPNEQGLFTRIDSHWFDNLEAWEKNPGEAFSLRSSIPTQLDNSPLEKHFRDPAYMLRYVSQYTEPWQFIPQMLRGRAHGDLHGRNVLVGRVKDRVLWPAVYDYGDMGTSNLVAWDFAKLETEFKQRAYPLVFSSAGFTAQVIEFEKNVHIATEMARNTGTWPRLSEPSSSSDRMQWLLLQLRRNAMDHLSQQGRSRLWLAEYYFVLVVYGLNAARFGNLTPVEALGAYLSSGCAAARYLPIE